MIDLKRTMITAVSNGEIKLKNVTAYLEEAKKQGCSIMGGNSIEHAVYVLGRSGGDSFLCCNSRKKVFYRKKLDLGPCGELEDETVGDFKKITLADLKPERTKAEFVKCEFSSLSKAFEEHEKEPLHIKCVDGEFQCINDLGVLHNVNNGKDLYRKVERDVTWQDEVCEFLNEKPIRGRKLSVELIAELDDIEWDVISEPDFIGMCHLVAEMTDKPE